MKRSAEIAALEQRLGHRFADPERLRRALTHSSMSAPGREDNQRLEFLGDAVLQLAGALRYFHGMGVAHMDLKPENCMREPEGRLPSPSP